MSKSSTSEVSFVIFLIGVSQTLVKPTDLEPKLATRLEFEPINHSIYVFSQIYRRNFFPLQISLFSHPGFREKMKWLKTACLDCSHTVSGVIPAAWTSFLVSKCFSIWSQFLIQSPRTLIVLLSFTEILRKNVEWHKSTDFFVLIPDMTQFLVQVQLFWRKSEKYKWKDNKWCLTYTVHRHFSSGQPSDLDPLASFEWSNLSVTSKKR
jgi:hypothetical protein